jgi:error-prone DNA polymerase
LTANDNLAAIILPLLAAWRDVRRQAAELDLQLVAAARKSHPSQLLITIQGIGAVTALAYVAAIEDRENFSKLPLGRSVAWANGEVLPIGQG